MIAYAADDPEVRSAYLVFRGRYLSNEASISVVRKFEDALDRTMTRLIGAGKEVYIFLPVVETGFDPRLCLGSLPFGRSAPQPCDISRSKDERHTELLRNSIGTVLTKHPKVHVVTPNDYFCSGDICPVVRDGHSMFKDENHLSYTGSMFQGRALDSLIRNSK